jgi:WD40 repeat protein
VPAVTVFPDGRRVAALAVTPEKSYFTGRKTLMRAVVTVRGAATGRVEGQTESTNPDLAELTVVGPYLVGRAGRDLLVWDADLSRPAEVVRTGKRQVAAVAAHPSGRWLATVAKDAAVTVWDAGSWRPVRALAWDVGRLGAVAFSGNGLAAAAGGDGGTVVVWDVD